MGKIVCVLPCSLQCVAAGGAGPDRARTHVLLTTRVESAGLARAVQHSLEMWRRVLAVFSPVLVTKSVSTPPPRHEIQKERYVGTKPWTLNVQGK